MYQGDALREHEPDTRIRGFQKPWSAVRRHLVCELGMREVAATDAGPVTERFNASLANHADALTARGGMPTFLLPPAWYSPG